MRALLERSHALRIAVALVAAVCVMGLVRAADAGGDPGVRRATFIPDELLTMFGLAAPPPATAAAASVSPADAPNHHRPRRIWAASDGRPLRIALRSRHKAAGKALRIAADRAALRGPLQAFRLVPPPTRTPLVSIYQDRTLRSGDAVMLDDGVHVFRDDGAWPHRRRDFVRLQFVAGLDWHLRRTLAPFDNNPPTRWTSIMVPPA